MIAPHGGFILVHVNTSVEECEKRDRKGLYAKARAGIIKEFTGISDPYDVPADAEVVIDTTKLSRRRSGPGNLPAAGKGRLHRSGRDKCSRMSRHMMPWPTMKFSRRSFASCSAGERISSKRRCSAAWRFSSTATSVAASGKIPDPATRRRRGPASAERRTRPALRHHQAADARLGDGRAGRLAKRRVAPSLDRVGRGVYIVAAAEVN